MRPRAGIWIDHRKAVIVFLTDTGSKLGLVRSNVERQLRPNGGLRAKSSYGPQDAPPDDRRENELTGHLNVYFEKVLARLLDAESVLIFGPGESKNELRKRILRHHEQRDIVGVETVDKMTDRQFVALVRQGYSAPGRQPRLERRGGFHHHDGAS